jgi:cardiolipin synthase (CMP-forming)
MAQNRSALLAFLPNLLTASRIVAAPLLALAVLAAQAPRMAAVLVLFAALSDLLDGMVARASGQVSDLGEVLDPIADKILVVTALLLLLAERSVQGAGVWAVLTIVWRELLISGLREYVRLRGFPAPVSSLAKFKAAAQYLSVILLFAARIPSQYSAALSEAGAVLLWAAAALTLYTGADYLWHAWRQSWK